MFDKYGGLVSEEDAGRRTRERNYTEQLHYVNRQIEDLIDELLAQSEVLPIIVLQSDEGPYPKRYLDTRGKLNEYGAATTREIQIKFGILNAYYLPGVDSGSLYSRISPVNSFRFIFNQYFDAGFPLLADRSFIFDGSFYDFRDVSGILKTD